VIDLDTVIQRQDKIRIKWLICGAAEQYFGGIQADVYAVPGVVGTLPALCPYLFICWRICIIVHHYTNLKHVILSPGCVFFRALVRRILCSPAAKPDPSHGLPASREHGSPAQDDIWI
jgi:hypothetical protein